MELKRSDCLKHHLQYINSVENLYIILTNAVTFAENFAETVDFETILANTFLNLHKPWRQSFTFCWVYYPFYTFILYLIKMVLMRENIRMFLSCLRWINHNAIKLFVKLTMLILLLHNILLPYQLYNFESWISTVEFLSCAICSNFFIVVKSICFIFLKRRESLLVGYDYFVRINKAVCLSVYIS